MFDDILGKPMTKNPCKDAEIETLGMGKKEDHDCGDCIDESCACDKNANPKDTVKDPWGNITAPKTLSPKDFKDLSANDLDDQDEDEEEEQKTKKPDDDDDEDDESCDGSCDGCNCSN